MKMNFPITIQSDTGEKLIFHGITAKDGLEYLEVSNEVQPGAGPPMHVHHLQDESLTVVRGKIGYEELDGPQHFAGPGATVLFRAGVAHRFWNAGDDLLVCTGFVTPANNLVYFLSEVYKSMNANNGRPGLYDAAFLLSRYKSEFAMLEIPAFVQKVLFPVALFFGNLLGKHRKFAGAPAPV
jgi:quercetin dioxygenase-like cupin family protein